MNPLSHMFFLEENQTKVKTRLAVVNQLCFISALFFVTASAPRNVSCSLKFFSVSHALKLPCKNNFAFPGLF